MVILKGHYANGSDEHPAVVTRVWSQMGDRHLVNLTAFPDACAPESRTSVYLFASRDAMQAAGLSYGAFWPERV